MSDNINFDQYLVKAIEPASGEQVAFVCANLNAAHAKCAELRMSRFQDVIISLARSSEEQTSAT